MRVLEPLTLMRSPQTGSIQMMDLYSTEQRVSSAPVSVNAHKNELVCLAINQQGSMVATASTKVHSTYYP